jgi:hypothetical protein
MPEEYGLKHYLQWLGAVATFVTAGAISGMYVGDVSWFKIHLFFFVSGVLAFLVLFFVNEGEINTQLVGGCVVLAFLPTVLILIILAVVLGIIALVLLPLLRALIGQKRFDKRLDAVAGFFLKIMEWRKRKWGSTVTSNAPPSAYEQVKRLPVGTIVLSADLCSGTAHSSCQGFESADLAKHNVPSSKVGEPIFCTCPCHKDLARVLRHND